MEKKVIIENKEKFENIESLIAKLYLFFLPFRMISPLLFLNSAFKGAAVNLDFLFNLLGILFYFLVKQGKLKLNMDRNSKTFYLFIFLIFTLNIISIIMATYIQLTFGSYAGETAFSGITGMIIYLIQYIFIVAYNLHVISILKLKDVRNILSKLSIFLLMLGYFQILVLLYKGIFLDIIHAIDKFNILWPGDFMPKLSLTGSEGASAGTIFSILILPFLLTNLYFTKNIKYIIQILLWFPVVVFMQSTSGYLMIIITFLTFTILKNNNNLNRKIFLYTIIGFLSLLIFSLGINFFKDLLPESIRYIVFEKINDKTNGSTIARTVPLYTNLKTFLQFPFLGVGNGLQGYFYVKNYPSWAINAPGGTARLFYESAKNTIVNGGLFFPSLLSGYGLFGMTFIILFLNRIRKSVINYKKNDNFYLIYCKLTLPAIIICGFQSEFVGNFCIWFVISLFFIDFNKYGRFN